MSISMVSTWSTWFALIQAICAAIASATFVPKSKIMSRSGRLYPLAMNHLINGSMSPALTLSSVGISP